MSGSYWRVIESLQNGQAKIWEQLTESRGIKKHGEFLLAGRKSAPEALAAHPDRFHALLALDPAQIEGWTIPAHVEKYRLSRALFDALDVSGTGAPLLVGKVPAMSPADLSAAPKGLELVCALGDPNNLGAALRSAAAFGATRIILMSEAVHPFHPKALRAAANAQFELTLLRGPSWETLDEATGPIFALDAGGEDMAALDWPRDLRLVLGEEGRGIPSTLKLRRLSIPTTGAVESLNATVAASLALYAHYIAGRRASSS